MLRSAARAPRPARPADRGAGRRAALGAARRAASLPTRCRHPERRRPRRRDRRPARIRTPKTARELPRPRPVRTIIWHAAPAGIDHEGRPLARPQAARRGGLALPPPAASLAYARTPQGVSPLLGVGHRDRLD